MLALGQNCSRPWHLLLYPFGLGLLHLVRRTDPGPVQRGLFSGALLGSVLFAALLLAVVISFLAKAALRPRASEALAGPRITFIAVWPNPPLGRTTTTPTSIPLSLGHGL